MLELLNPSAKDLAKFALSALRIRQELTALQKKNPAAAKLRVTELFCSPPEAARRTPDLARLKDDAKRYFKISAAAWAKEEPVLKQILASASRQTIQSRGEEMMLYRWAGKSKKAPRVLFCHGWEGYALSFAPMIAALQDAGCEVWAMDHLAHGASGGLLSGLPIALEGLLDVAAHIEQSAGKLHALVGHSLGSAAAAWAVANRAIAVERLVLLAPFYDTNALTKAWAKAHLLPDSVRQLLVEGLHDSTERTFEEFMPDALAPRLDALKTRTLVMHDRADFVTAFVHSAALAKAAQTVELEELKGLGHVALLADEGVVSRFRAFVSS
jgi:pimeloyl-ACP methyl ester carboxylesterase